MKAWISASLLLPLTFSFACGSDPQTPPVKTPVTLSAITVAPATRMLMKDEVFRFTATGAYSDGTTKDLTFDASWSSADTSVATISTTGEVTARGPGDVQIRASLEDKMGTAAVTVLPVALVSVALDRTTLALIVGDTTNLVLTGTLEDDTTIDLTATAEWVSSAPDVASVAQGLVTALSEGTARVEITVPGTELTASAMITVNIPAPTAILVEPDSVQVPRGLTQQFTATAVFEDGSQVDVTSAVSWMSSNQNVATVDASGLATSLIEGITSISAVHSSGKTASATMVVEAARVGRITVTPVSTQIGRGELQAYRAQATYTDGTTRDLTNAAVWSSSDTTVAAPHPTQRATFVGGNAGTATISATDPLFGASSNDTGDSAVLEVLLPFVESIAVLPMAETLALGRDVQLAAVAVYSDNTSADVTNSVIWSSTAPAVAAVDSLGFVTSLSVGTAVISATDPATGLSSDDASFSSVITVAPAALESIEVTPSARAMVIGSVQQFTATGSYSDGTTENISSSVVWAPSSSALTVNNNGVATAVSVGTVTLVARDTESGVSSADSNQSATVTISDATLLSLAITPTSTTVPAGAEVRFTAVGTFDNGADVDMTALVTWNSSIPAVAEVNNTGALRGLAIGRSAGATTISAVEPSSGVTSNGSGGSATLNVTATQLVSIEVLPRPSVVDRNRTRQFTAIGHFNGGGAYPITNTVTWASSNSALATISNAVATRGLATGVAVGVLTISATDPVTSISSDTSLRSSQLTVNQGIVTLSGAWPGPVREVDGTANFAINVGTVNFNPGDFPSGALVTDINVAINFLKTDGSCIIPLSGSAFHGETNFALLGPTGTQVILASPGAWSGDVVMSSPVTVTFDQSAAAVPSLTPVNGTFLPAGNLATFVGQNPAGPWTLLAGDSAGGDPLCVFTFTMIVTAE
jgi:hypothetical protein